MSELPLTIRCYQAGDLSRLHEIDRICFPEDVAFSLGELLFHLCHPKSIARVAEGPRGILGFVLARIDSLMQSHVITLDVVPEFRRCRIGTNLMNELHSELEKQHIFVAFLEVNVANTPAQRLYEGLEYRRLGTLSGYYRGREDAYRMARLMKPRLDEPQDTKA